MKKKTLITITVPNKWWIPKLKIWIKDTEVNDYTGYDFSSCQHMNSIKKALKLELPVGSLITRYVIKRGKRYATEWEVI